MIKYEYKKVVSIDFSEKELNDMGKEGWDNYSIIGNAYMFKRQSNGMIPDDKIEAAIEARNRKKYEPKNRK